MSMTLTGVATLVVMMGIGSLWLGCAGCSPTSPLYAPIAGPERYAPDTSEMAEYQPDYQITEMFDAGLKKAPHGVTWVQDPALDCAAKIVGQHYVATKEWPIPSLQQQWIAWRCGSPFRARMALRKFSGGASGEAASILMNALHDDAVAMAKEPNGAFGLAGESSGPRHWFTLATRSRIVEIKPVSKTPPPGGALEIDGCFLVPRANPVLHVTAAGPAVLSQPLAVDDKGCFRARATLPREAGVYYVEVTSEEASSEASARQWDDWYSSSLWFPLYVGVPEPTSLPAELVTPVQNPSVAEWGQALVDAYNRERSRYGLAPLASVKKWDKLANAEAAKMANDGAPTADRDLPQDLQAESTGRSWATVQYLNDHATSSLMRPSKRAQILAKATTGICLGVAPTPKQKGEEEDDEGQEPSFYSVVEFILQDVQNASN